MEGTLLVPPERGTIIGRAVWKTRYVVIGPLPQKDANSTNISLSQVLSTARSIKDVGSWREKPQQRVPTDAIFLSVYKSKDDWEAIHQYSIASITECQVQQVAHRKQGHVLPTLSIQFSPDPTTEKLRKRRSSRATGLSASKDSGPITLWFRLAEDSQYRLSDWAHYLHSLTRSEGLSRQPLSPVSPISPLSPIFVNPFGVAQGSEANEISSTSSAKDRILSKLQSKPSNRAQTPSHHATHSSESPSLRSRKSDISSHASLMNPTTMGLIPQHYTAVHPSDLPSPALTMGEYQDQFIEGWTSAQGRSSTLSSPARGRASTASSYAPGQANIDTSSPPAPRETILDRAFQLRYIPGADREVPGEENLSSLARFEALMQEVEDRRKPSVGEATLAAAATISKKPLRSTWEEDDESDDDEFGAEVEDDEEDSDEDAYNHGFDPDGIRSPASRALEFITNRPDSRSHWSSVSRMSHYSDSGGLTGGPSILRPHTAHSRLRPSTQRTSSQPNIISPSFASAAPSTSRIVEEGAVRRAHEKRHSTSDVKHLNVNDFAKRLSSSSSLLLVQSNVSTASSRGSSDFDPSVTPRGTLSPARAKSPEQRDERCRWRGSVGVFGSTESGFL
ncbi:hypothetical protein GGR56DRAFT_98209 [Xylariaceae sp. FL0804]|nr:hypothetical protein GGR56DRAFT_98209 [Xylariaceae sp. FL0804]